MDTIVVFSPAPGPAGGAVAVNHHAMSSPVVPGTVSSYTFSAFDVGLDSEGELILGVSWEFGNAVTDVLVDGVSAGSPIASVGTTEYCAFYRVAAPGDAPLDVTIQQTSGFTSVAGICAFRVSGASSTLNDSAAALSVTSTLTLDVDTVADGAVLAFANARAVDQDFSGIGTILQSDDTSTELHSGYSLTTTAETRAVSLTGGSSTYNRGVCIALAPA